jgi:hypothetical protein
MYGVLKMFGLLRVLLTKVLPPFPKGEFGKSHYVISIHYKTRAFEKVEYKKHLQKQAGWSSAAPYPA